MSRKIKSRSELKTKHLISEEAEQRIIAAHRKQDQNAHALGVCVAEYELMREKLVQEFRNGPDYHLRLGALVAEFDGHRIFFMDTIRRTKEEQRLAGEAALREAGIDANDGENYSINGRQILKLVDGKLVKEF